MKFKALFLIIGCLSGGFMKIHGQAWIGTQFRLDTSITLQYEHMPDLSRLKSCIHDDTLYFVHAQAFQNKAANYAATVYALSLRDYSQTEYCFPFPKTKQRKESLANSFWINDIDICHDKVVMSLQNYIVLYNRKNGNQFCYDTMFYHRNAIVTYFYRGELYFLSEDHDKGYSWFHFNRANGQEEFIRELPYEAPHVVQANPNLYLYHNPHFVFFLSTRYPVLHKYTLAGQWVEDITFELPNWHPFEDEYIQKSLSFPYGVERIYGTMAEIFQYSYPKVVFPIGDAYLLYYTQYDTLTHKSTLQYAIREPNGRTLRFIRQDNDTSAYGGDRFPFNLFDQFADKSRLSWNDCLIEICEDNNLPWAGCTPSQYLEAQEKYFKQNEPIPKVRIMHYKNNDPLTQPFFYDSNQQLHSLNNMPKKKTVFLINNRLECSACKKALLTQINRVDTNKVHIGILFPFIPGALQEWELNKSIREILHISYQLYYLDKDHYTAYPYFISSKISTYPAVMLFESGKAPILFSTDDIFVDDPYSIEFTTTFQKAWKDFMKH